MTSELVRRVQEAHNSDLISHLVFVCRPFHLASRAPFDMLILRPPMWSTSQLPPSDGIGSDSPAPGSRSRGLDRERRWAAPACLFARRTSTTGSGGVQVLGEDISKGIGIVISRIFGYIDGIAAVYRCVGSARRLH